MPKKLFAVTNVKIGSAPEEFFPAGTVVDHTMLTKAQLQELHDQGAVEVRTVDDENEPTPEAPETTENADANAEGSEGSEEENPTE